MTATAVRGGTIVTPDGVLEDGLVRWSDGVLTEVSAAPSRTTGRTPRPGPASPDAGMADPDVLDAEGCWVVPGFVDLHCHGGAGHPFSAPEPAAVRAAAELHRRHGTTTQIASLVSRPLDVLVREIGALRELVADDVFAGIHLEGPFLAAARCGAHNPAVLRPPEPDAVRRLLAAGAGTVRMVTLAPELDGAVDAVRLLAGAGVLAALGHTDAVEVQIRPAVDAGATVATHLFNGMRPLHHREPGAVGVLLDDDRVSVELICDLAHVHPTAVRLAARHAGTGRTVLVTDAIAAAGAGDGSYQIGGLAVTVQDGIPRLGGDLGAAEGAGPSGGPAGGAALAGSSLTMDAAFRNAVLGAGLTVPTVVAATATHPAALLGLGEHTGALRPGLAADLVVLDAGLRVRHVVRRGRLVTAAAHPE